MLYDESSDSWDRNAHYVLEGVYHGFRVLDAGDSIPTYSVQNYSLYFAAKAYSKVTETLIDEISSGKLGFTSTQPTQMHALGAIPKPNGSYRIITDCSKPDKISVNNYMKEVFFHFFVY